MDRVVEADLDAAEDLGELVEPVQVDLGEVVDVHAGELLDGRHRGRAAGLVAEEGQLVLAHARVLLAQLGLLVVHADAVGLVDLALLLRPDRAGEVDPVVARNGEADRLLAAGEDVDQDQRVGVIAAGAVGHAPALLPACSLARMLLGRMLPFQSRAALQPHQQDVLRARSTGRW